jgi:hypothetical protein
MLHQMPSRRSRFKSISRIMAICLVLSHSGFLWARAPLCRSLLLSTPVSVAVEPRELTFMAYNFENLFLKDVAIQRGTVRQLESQDIRFKSVSDMRRQIQILKELEPDILVGTEIHSVYDFRAFLESDPATRNVWDIFLKRGNDARGINIAFLVKKSLNVRVKLTSHKDLIWKDPKTQEAIPQFSRDLPVLTLFKKDDDKTPLLVVIGNHAKSKRDRNGDPESTRYRTSQYEAAGRIIDQIRENNRKIYGRDIPLVMAGDFNTDTVKGTEVAPILSRLQSVFDSVPGKTFSYEDRVSHFYFGPSGRRATPLDGIFVSPGTLEVTDAYVYQYKDLAGRVMPDPRSFKQRQSQPGDHEPIVAHFKLSKD